MSVQEERGRVFRALHQREGAFVIPNPWDIGSARLLAGLGFEALATTSAGFAFSLGRRDYGIAREELAAHVTLLAAATDLPVSVDMENGFGDAPEVAAETVRKMALAGAAGGSIEDATGKPDEPIYGIEFAAERIRAAAEAAHGLPFDFTLTARCENFLYDRPDLADTIRRLQMYQEAGADVLYAPGLTSQDDIADVVNSVDRPVNVLVGFKGLQLSVPEASALGVKRLSVGSGLARVAYGALLNAANAIREQEAFTLGDSVPSLSEMSAMFPK